MDDFNITCAGPRCGELCPFCEVTGKGSVLEVAAAGGRAGWPVGTAPMPQAAPGAGRSRSAFWAVARTAPKGRPDGAGRPDEEGPESDHRSAGVTVDAIEHELSVSQALTPRAVTPRSAGAGLLDVEDGQWANGKPTFLRKRSTDCLQRDSWRSTARTGEALRSWRLSSDAQDQLWSTGDDHRMDYNTRFPGCRNLISLLKIALVLFAGYLIMLLNIVRIYMENQCGDYFAVVEFRRDDKDGESSGSAWSADESEPDDTEERRSRQ